jgi:hypothetical protein
VRGLSDVAVVVAVVLPLPERTRDARRAMPPARGGASDGPDVMAGAAVGADDEEETTTVGV